VLPPVMPPYCWAPALLLAGVVPVILAEAVEAEKKGSWVRLHPAQRLFGRWSSPPRLPPTPSFSDGPYAGNGDLGVTIGGPPERVVQYCALKSFWTGAFFESGSSHGLQRRWGMLLAASLVWDAPLLRGASYDATQELGTGRMNLTLGDGSFESSTFVGQADAGQGANFYATEFGVSAAARPLTLTLQIRPGNPDLRSKQDYNAGSTRGGTADGGVVWTARNNTNITGNASNHYTGDSFSFTHLTMGLAAKVTAADAGPAPVVTHAHDGTHNGTHSLAMVLQPGRRYVLTVWVACHEWGKGDPVTEAISNLARVGSNDGRATAWEAANTWWQRHWASTPVVRHFSEAAEQYYYGTLYTMASSKRAGTVGIDRQGPFMTQDNSIWPYICNNVRYVPASSTYRILLSCSVVGRGGAGGPELTVCCAGSTTSRHRILACWQQT
jgi:alpha-L-fucosidase 2